MKKQLTYWFPLLTVLCLFACDMQMVDPNPGKAVVQVYLTDDPDDYQQVNVDLLQVRIKTKDTSWVDLNTNQGIYDLLQYQAGDDTLIVNDTLPPGEIQELRLVLGTDNSIMVDSVLYPLTIPSSGTSGLKIKLQKLMVSDSLTDITLDFDVEKSVIEKGNGEYQLKPTIKVLP